MNIVVTKADGKSERHTTSQMATHGVGLRLEDPDTGFNRTIPWSEISAFSVETFEVTQEMKDNSAEHLKKISDGGKTTC